MTNENENDMLTVPYVAFESTMEREDRKHKRLWIALILTIILLVLSNGYWIWYECQFEDVVTTTVTQEGQTDGDGNIILNNDGEVNYGIESETDGNEN